MRPRRRLSSKFGGRLRGLFAYRLRPIDELAGAEYNSQVRNLSYGHELSTFAEDWLYLAGLSALVAV